MLSISSSSLKIGTWLFPSKPCEASRFGSAGSRRRCLVRAKAAKLPAGVEAPRVEPKLQSPLFGFTRNAEVWNSRACMIGLIGTFILELILNKGILQVIGVDVGKGLNIPL